MKRVASLGIIVSLLLLVGIALIMLHKAIYYKEPVPNCCITITSYKEGCHLESCAKKYTVPCRVSMDDVMDYNITFNEPIKAIKVNYYHK
jgi:hypothetical protein